MLPDRVSNPGPLTYESGALPIALRGPAKGNVFLPTFRLLLINIISSVTEISVLLLKKTFGFFIKFSFSESGRVAQSVARLA